MRGPRSTAASRVAVRANSHRIRRRDDRDDDLHGDPRDQDVVVRETAERRAGHETLQHLLRGERAGLGHDEDRREPPEPFGPVVRAGERADHDRGHPGDQQHQDGLVERGEVRVARALQGERALMGVGDRDQVREGVPEHQPGRGRAEGREASEPGSFTHADRSPRCDSAGLYAGALTRGERGAMRAEDVRTVGVIGCGLMGSGIAEVVARAGQDAVVLETSDELVERGRQRIETSTLRAVERNRLDAEERAAVLGRISLTTDVQDLADVDLVIEAATEDHDTKVGMFRRLDEVTKPEVILASNTSSIPIADLGAATSRPDKVLGMHFFNPVPVMGLIELVRAISTSDDTMAFGRAYGVVLGKTTVESRDRAGFIVNALLIPYLNGAIRMLEDGFATREDIDTAVHLGLNHPMGPLRLIDLIGLDTHLFIANVLFEEFKEPTYAPPPLLRRMVTAGRLGRKVGRGFYDYEG